MLVKISDNLFAIMYAVTRSEQKNIVDPTGTTLTQIERTNQNHIIYINGDGKIVARQTVEEPVCSTLTKPVYYNGHIVWIGKYANAKYDSPQYNKRFVCSVYARR